MTVRDVGGLAFNFPDVTDADEIGPEAQGAGRVESPADAAADDPREREVPGPVSAEQGSPEASGDASVARGPAPFDRPDNLDFIREKRHLSFSQLSTYSDCGEKYRLRYVEKVPTKPAGALIGGRAVHKAIEVSEAEGYWPDEMAYFASDSPGLVPFHEVLDAEVEAAGGPDEIAWGGREIRGSREDYAWWKKNGEFMMRRYRTTRVAMDESGWGVVEGGVEMRVLADLPGVDVPVLGFLDKLLMHEAGEPVVVDYSTGRVGGKNAFQFATYAALLEISRGLEARRGVAIYLRAGDAAKRVAPITFADLVPRMAETYAELVRGIRAGLFIPNPSSFCSSCSVNADCWYWQGSRPAE